MKLTDGVEDDEGDEENDRVHDHRCDKQNLQINALQFIVIV